MSHLFPIFNINQKSDIRDYMNKNGYVVINNILTKEECKLTTFDINNQIQKLDSRFNIFKPETYDYMVTHGQYGMITKKPIFTDQFLINRQNKNIIEAFKILYGDEDLIVNHDRFTFYRPTLTPGKPEYKTPYVYPNLHLDTDPQMYMEHYNIFEQKQKSLLYKDKHRDFITENNYFTFKDQPIYQGIINLWENSYEDGGLHLVPEFHNNFEEWYHQKKFKKNPGDDTGFHFSASNRLKICTYAT
jgi:hypothetical protein